MTWPADGLTKIELLVCMGVIGLLTVIGAAGWRQVLPTYRLDVCIRGLCTATQIARIRSIRDNTVVTVTLDARKRRYEAFVDDGSGAGATAKNGIRESMERLIVSRALPAGIEVHRVTFPAKRLRFNSRGMPQGGGSFYLKNARDQYKGISVGFSGSITIKTSTNGGRTWKKL